MYKYKLIRANGIPSLTVEAIIGGDKILSCPKESYELFKNFWLEDMPEEYLYLACTNAKCRVIGVFEVSHGGIDEAHFHVSSIFTRALLCGARFMVLAHNHPSGDPTPSEPDIEFSKQVKELGEKLGISLQDSIVIGNGCYFSMLEHGVLF